MEQGPEVLRVLASVPGKPVQPEQHAGACRARPGRQCCQRVSQGILDTGQLADRTPAAAPRRTGSVPPGRDPGPGPTRVEPARTAGAPARTCSRRSPPWPPAPAGRPGSGPSSACPRCPPAAAPARAPAASAAPARRRSPGLPRRRRGPPGRRGLGSPARHQWCAAWMISRGSRACPVIEPLGVPSVQLGRLPRQHVALDRLPQKRVPEGVTGPVPVDRQQPGVHELAQPGSQPRLLEPGHRPATSRRPPWARRQRHAERSRHREKGPGCAATGDRAGVPGHRARRRVRPPSAPPRGTARPRCAR